MKCCDLFENGGVDVVPREGDGLVEEAPHGAVLLGRRLDGQPDVQVQQAGQNASAARRWFQVPRVNQTLQRPAHHQAHQERVRFRKELA